MKDIHGKAIRDYYQNKITGPLILHNSYGEPEEMPVEVFFRDQLDFSTIEHLALMECKGKVLDMGAGAGAHALVLQALGFETYALESSPGCAEVMKNSGVKNVLLEDYRLHIGKYDTLLMLMNGIGLAGTLAELPSFLSKCKKLLNPGGQILFDSSDISYLYEEELQRPAGYFGDIQYQYEYKGEKGDWFNWVYVDPHKFQEIAQAEGFVFEVLTADENDQYLAQLVAIG